jgi:hypothetical protein
MQTRIYITHDISRPRKYARITSDNAHLATERAWWRRTGSWWQRWIHRGFA